MTTIKSTDNTFESIIKKNKIVLWDGWAKWCAPCLSLSPILEEISNEMTNVVVAKHNIDEEPNLPTKLNVRSIPTMILFVNAEQKSVKIGATNKENIVSWIKENI